MNNKNNPLSPHIQIYSWHISSIISISHRITGVINIIALTFVSIWISSMLFGVASYEFVENISGSAFPYANASYKADSIDFRNPLDI